MTKLKAYIVAAPDSCEPMPEILFTHTAIEARRAGANSMNEGELGGMTCNRAKHYDRYADEGTVPASVLVEDGWYFEGSCGHNINHDDLYDRGLTPDGVLGSLHSAVYCNAECRRIELTDRAARDDAGYVKIMEIEDRLRRKFGDTIEITNTHAFAKWDKIDGKYVATQCNIDFKFPGQKIGSCLCKIDGSIHVPNGAMDGFNKFMETLS
jgi:hypothetical protein